MKSTDGTGVPRIATVGHLTFGIRSPVIKERHFKLRNRLLVMKSVSKAVMRVVVRKIVVDTGLWGIPDLILRIGELGSTLVLMVRVIVILLTMIAGVASLIWAVANLVLNLSPVVNAVVVLILQILRSLVSSKTTLGSVEIVRSPLDAVVYGRGVGVHHTIWNGRMRPN